MGEQSIWEVTMVALLFLLLCVIFLIAAAGRIWLDATPVGSPTIESSSEQPRQARYINPHV
jgi:hypothetical protein